MKRSTLTLSILTALLVSACGGSGSDDQGAKDPDPKPTPTNPTPSNPTPSKPNPGSSVVTPEPEAVNPSPEHGSAPIESGGNQSTGGVYIPPKDDDGAKDKDKDDDGAKDKDKDDDGAKDKDKDDDGAKDKDKDDDAKDKDKDDKDDKDNQSPSSVEQAKNALKDAKADVGAKERKLKDSAAQKKARFDAYHTVVTPATGIFKDDAELETAKIRLDKLKASNSADYPTEKEKYDKAVALKQEWMDAKAKEREDQEAFDKAKLEKEKAEIAVKLAEAEEGLKKAEVNSEKEYQEAMKKKSELELALKEATADKEALDIKETQIGQDEGVLEREKKDIELALTQATEEQKTELGKKQKSVEDALDALGKEKKDVAAKKRLAVVAKQNAKKAFDDLDTAGLETIAKNRGVAGVSSFSDKNFVGIQKADHTSGKWVITFDGSEKAVDVQDGVGTNGGGDLAFGKFGKINEKPAAYADIENVGHSIYGYVDDKFYSVGTVTDSKTIEQNKEIAAKYVGHALLKSKDKKNLVATFEGTANFVNKSFGGGFKDFKEYTDSTSAVDTSNPKLKDPIPFGATIKGNKFFTENAQDGHANVYGFFYGTDAKGAGGLVELKDVFHGSFGGSK